MRGWHKLLMASVVAWGLSAQAQSLPPQQNITVFGAKIAYYEAGHGHEIVLIHGYGGSARGDWGKIIPVLAQNHHVIALDLLGFGNSDKPFINYGVQTWVDMVGEFLRLKHVSHFTLAGESLGGWIAARYAIEASRGDTPGGPDLRLPKPSRLILCDAAGIHATMAQFFLPGHSLDGPVSLGGDSDLLKRIFHHPQFTNDAALKAGMTWSIAKGDGWAMASFAANRDILNETVDNELGAITMPTLVVWGRYDALLPLADGVYYAHHIKGARLVTVPDAGHAPMIETPDAFMAAVGDFWGS